MDSDFREQEVEDTALETTLTRQQSIRDDTRLPNEWLKNPKRLVENSSFDNISLGLVVSALLASMGFLSVFGVRAALPSTIAVLTSVFAFLSVRESKRDREASVAPTLFVGKQDGEYGIVNLGSGPAHELSVTVTDGPRDDYEPEDSEVEGKILRVDDFLSLEREDEPDYVHMEYRSNVGHKEYEVTRKVLSDGG